jgi:hypothetical protein
MLDKVECLGELALSGEVRAVKVCCQPRWRRARPGAP